MAIATAATIQSILLQLQPGDLQGDRRPSRPDDGQADGDLVRRFNQVIACKCDATTTKALLDRYVMLC